ncbi:hypothetical protein PENTCL1PPCAC_13792, partial [Pristionchus entomophagus]
EERGADCRVRRGEVEIASFDELDQLEGDESARIRGRSATTQTGLGDVRWKAPHRDTTNLLKCWSYNRKKGIVLANRGGGVVWRVHSVSIDGWSGKSDDNRRRPLRT